jgi:hypothetical protein
MDDAMDIHLELDFDDTAHREVHEYVQRVTRALGLRGESSYVQTDEVASAYIALDGRLPSHPDRDVALLWDERDGWAAAVEEHSGDPLRAIAHLGDEVRPAPGAVARAVRDLFQDNVARSEGFVTAR